MAKTRGTTAKKKTVAPKPAAASKETASQKNTEPAEPKQRRLKVHSYKSFRLEKRAKRSPGKPLPSGFQLLRTAFGTIRQHWKVFLGISVVYGLLTAGLVTGFSAVNLADAKHSFSEVVSGQVNQLATGLSLFVYMLGSAGTTSSPTASVYQIMLGIVVSLALIWTLRQVYAGHVVRIRDGFYQGMYPLVQFIIVMVVVGLQLVPLIAGASIYQLVISNGIAATIIEQILWLLLFLLAGMLSIYMVCSSLFALYIVSLPDVTPLTALRAAKKLVLHRRWAIIRKVLFLPVALLVLIAIVMVPVILVATPVAPWLFFLLSTVLLTIVHNYLYALYKALL